MKAIAVLGSASGLKESEGLADRLGEALAQKKFTVVTGAGEGLPLRAAVAAKKAGGLVIGISPSINSADHKKQHPTQPEAFDFISYSGFGQKGRNVLLVRSADAVITIGGSIGTLNEFTIAYDEGKVIGVLEGSGGVSDKIREISKLGEYKNTGARMVYSSDPKELVEKISELLK